MRLLITGGTVVTPAGTFPADLLCEDGRIAGILDPGSAVEHDEVVDATGKLVFPGFIDPHVHSRDPGATHKEDFSHSTRGALVGGVTTILEMPNAIPPVESVDVFRVRREEHARNAWVDFGLWGLSLGTTNIDQLGPLFAEGAVAVKLFWGYALHRETRSLVYNTADVPADQLLLPPDNGEVLEVFKEVARHGGVLAAHCEDRDILAYSERALGDRGIRTYDDLLAARPAIAEAATISLGAEMSKLTGCRFHVVHMASATGLAAVRAAQQRGIRITAETCPQYLTLTKDDYERVGPVMKVYPPIRTQEDQDELWSGIVDGSITSVGSDHAPHTVAEKSQDFSTQPAGNVGVETIAPLMIDAMVRGKLSAEQLSRVLSGNTAELYGIAHRKGAIRIGADADLTIVDPDARRVIRNEELVAKQKVTPWNGVELRGAPVVTVLRGQVAARNGEPVGDRRGEFIAARHPAPVSA